MGGARSTYVGGNRCLQGSGKAVWGRQFGRRSRRGKDNIKMSFTEQNGWYGIVPYRGKWGGTFVSTGVKLRVL